jgi:hypothetical protein
MPLHGLAAAVVCFGEKAVFESGIRTGGPRVPERGGGCLNTRWLNSGWDLRSKSAWIPKRQATPLSRRSDEVQVLSSSSQLVIAMAVLEVVLVAKKGGRTHTAPATCPAQAMLSAGLHARWP